VAREPLVDRLLRDYRDDPDPGVHAAAEWLLRRWEMGERLARANLELSRAGPGRRRGEVAKPGWYVDGQGQTFAVIPAPGPFEIGSPADEKGRVDNEERRRVQIDYPFAVALKLVTVAQFKMFRPDFDYSKEWSPGEDTPINAVTWYEAAAYCNWLSAREKIPRDQWCYEPNAKGEYAEGMRIKADYQSLSGYRLPRDVEWEYACRAGTVTAWSHGSDEALLGHYAWYGLNANSTMHPVGALKPNGLGLFDMHGNAWQWCQEVSEKEDEKYNLELKDGQDRIERGGAVDGVARNSRSASRDSDPPTFRGEAVGFRVARTFR
jgi:formylglycine-generating enzyme required for sulfatase activity